MNYTELQTTVADYLHRSDLTARIPTFIQLAESKLNRSLRLLQQETTATITTSLVSRFNALPDDFSEVVSLSYGNDKLIQKSVSEMAGLVRTGQGYPTYFAVTSQLELDIASDQAYDLTLAYFKKWDIATDATNWLLTNYPEIYIYATCLEASPFIRDMEQMNTWNAMLGEAIATANQIAAKNRSTALSTEIGITGSFDIVRGY